MSKVLIVDDEEAYRDELELALSGEHDVKTASSGREGLDLATRYRPDVLVTDWMLKNHIHGLHLVNVTRSVLPDTRAILITGFPSSDLVEDAAEARVLDFIEKPFDLTQIRRAVHQVAGASMLPADRPVLAMLEVDAAGAILYANDHARELLADTRAGVDAGNLAEIFLPETLPDLDIAADHWLAVTPNCEEPVVWHLRSQRPREGGRLVILRSQDEPQHIGHGMIEMLLGFEPEPITPWPFVGRVLVVDDEPLIRRTLVSQLESCGAGCYAVATPAEALRLLEKDEGLGFVIHDFRLGEGDVALSIRAMKETRPDVVIVGTSAVDHREDFAEMGVEHFLRKPWQIRNLINTLTGRIGNCASCDLPLPLRRPGPEEVGTSWVCGYCGARYRAVFDDTAPPDHHFNVRSVDGG